MNASNTAYTSATSGSFDGVTQRICPTSSSFKCSPPCGLLASSSSAPHAASTNVTPIIASCTSGQCLSVHVSSSAPASAALSAHACTAQPCGSRPSVSANTTPRPAIC